MQTSPHGWLIFEGANGSGKSTAIKKLGFDAKHTGGPSENVRHLYERVTALSSNEVIDRFPLISEWVYGGVGGKKTMVPRLSVIIDCFQEFYEQTCDPGLIHAGKTTIVFCRPSVLPQSLPFDPNKNYKSKEHHRLTEDHQDEIRDRYDFLMDYLSRCPHGVNVIRHDFIKDPSCSRLARRLTSVLPQAFTEGL